MVDYMIEICKDIGLETIYALMLSDNYRAIRLMKKMGFAIKYLDNGTVKATLNLKEEEPSFKSVEPKKPKRHKQKREKPRIQQIKQIDTEEAQLERKEAEAMKE